MVSMTAHGGRGPGFDPGQGRLSFLSEKSLNSAMCLQIIHLHVVGDAKLREEIARGEA